MDNAIGFCSFLVNSDFINFLELCQFFHFDVTAVHEFGFDSIIFFDELEFLVFFGIIINNHQNTDWSFVWRGRLFLLLIALLSKSILIM